MSLPGSISLLARFKSTPSGTAPVGTTGIAATQVAYGSGANQIKGSAQLLFIESSAMQFSTAVAGGIQLYNTADQVTNYERLELFWTGSVANIRTASGGSGSSRSIRLQSNTTFGAALQLNPGSAAPGQFNAVGFSTSATASVGYGFTGYASTATSGTAIAFSLTPTYNQSASASANTDFKISRTETALGSGAQLFAEFLAGAAGTTSIFSFGNTGIFTKPGGAIPLITTSSAITTGAGASAGTITNAPSVGNPTKWVPINDNGVTRYLPAW